VGLTNRFAAGSRIRIKIWWPNYMQKTMHIQTTITHTYTKILAGSQINIKFKENGTKYTIKFSQTTQNRHSIKLNATIRKYT